MAERFGATRGINFNPPDGHIVTLGTVPPVGMVDPDKAAVITDEIMNVWGLTNAAEKLDALVTLLLFFGEHGTSNRLDMTGSLVVHGRECVLSAVQLYTGEMYRQYAKVYFGLYMKYLIDNPVEASRIGKLRGYNPLYYTIACDFQDITLLSASQIEYVESKMRKALPPPESRRGSVSGAANGAANGPDGYDL